MSIAETIIKQMGGVGAFRAFIAAYDMLSTEDGLQFKFKGSRKLNVCIVKLNGNDLYDIEFGRVRKQGGIPTYKPVEEINDIYCDQLKGIFEKSTGLYLSF